MASSGLRHFKPWKARKSGNSDSVDGHVETVEASLRSGLLNGVRVQLGRALGASCLGKSDGAREGTAVAGVDDFDIVAAGLDLPPPRGLMRDARDARSLRSDGISCCISHGHLFAYRPAWA